MTEADDTSVAPEAWLSLGLSHMAERRFVEAVGPLRRAANHALAPALWRTCLAQALFLTGDFVASVDEFERAAHQEPLPENARATLAQARCLRDLCTADTDPQVDAAMRRYGREAGLDAERLTAFAEDAGSILAVFARTDAAAAVGRWRLGHAEGNAVLNYRQAVLEGAVFERAPPDYVEQHFDSFADRFDHQLVDMLGYAAPAELGRLVAEHRKTFGSTVDLGCGTGLAAPVLRPTTSRLVGVDLSERMLEKARERGDYDDLAKADLISYLAAHRGAFDLIFAADVLIYLGDLAEFFDAAVAALAPDGLLAFSTERAAGSWSLLSSGRFAHEDGYLDSLAAGRLTLLGRQDAALRMEGLAPVAGAYHVYGQTLAARQPSLKAIGV